MTVKSRAGTCRALAGALVLLMTVVTVHAQPVLYVDDDAPLGGDGQSWDTAYTYLQDALASAQPGSGVTEIRVAQGTFKPDQDEAGNVTPGDRNATFQLIDGVSLLSGYAGLGAADPDARDFELYETILSGDLLNDDDSGPAGILENVLHVITASGTGSATVLEGFTITKGHAGREGEVAERYGAGVLNVGGSPSVRHCIFLANTTAYATGQGGGMYNAAGAAPTIEYCRFKLNSAPSGGAMFNHSSTATITNCEFNGNLLGGGIYNDASSHVTVEDSCFNANDAFDAGLVNVGGSTAVVRRCRFEDNEGGAIRNSDASSLEVRTCTFEQNVGSADHAAGVHNEGQSTADISDSEFLFNDGSYIRGGAVASIGTSTITLHNCLFLGNGPSNLAAGAAVLNGNCTITNCAFIGNISAGGSGLVVRHSGPVESGEAIIRDCLFNGNIGFEWVGGLFVNWDNAIVENCTIVNNYNLLHSEGGCSFGGDNLTVRNNISWGNASSEAGSSRVAQFALSPTATGLVGFNCIENLENLPGNHLLDVTGNIATYPEFVDMQGVDGLVGTMDDDLHLLPTSPCINAGDPAYIPQVGAVDVDGEARVQVCQVDMGYDETGHAPDDCNGNGEPDGCEIESGATTDLNGNGIPDECDLDCDDNGTADFIEIMDDQTVDLNANGVLDVCEDCNGNGWADDIDILAGWSADQNANGIPDECDCLADLTVDGWVNTDDLVMLLGTWGPCSQPCPPRCAADISGDCAVDGEDFVWLLMSWGECIEP